MIRNALLSALFTALFLTSIDAIAADRNQARGEQCLSTANDICNNFSGVTRPRIPGQ